MKKIFFLALILPKLIAAQVPGQWTWMSGSSIPNYRGNFSAKGVAASSNQPPSLYEACEWVDKYGNFWLYGGGVADNVRFSADMWKFDLGTQQWTWIGGNNNADQKPVYGTQGIASASNTPGERTACYSWVDHAGDFWLYGGYGYEGVSTANVYGDLWKYNTTTETWAWMKGDTGVEHPYAYHYGIKGVESSANNPYNAYENGVSWTGDNNDLWLLDNGGCLWRYKISTNNWIWMKGTAADTSNLYPYPVYGVQGVFDAANTPGYNYFDYSRWKDSKGNLWYLSGERMVLWEYNVSANMWAWIDGDTAWSDIEKYNYGDRTCAEQDIVVKPRTRREDRACWIDNCDNLWLMGGMAYYSINDLIYYDIAGKRWVWAGNDTTESVGGVYGTKGVSSPGNNPSSRMGAVPFKDFKGNLWLFGGETGGHTDTAFADLWMYTIDTSCTKCHIVHDSTFISGIAYTQLAKQFTLSPNPARNEVIVTAKEVIASIYIYNAIGQLLYMSNCHSDKVLIDIATFPSGMYFARINNSETLKFVKL